MTRTAGELLETTTAHPESAAFSGMLAEGEALALERLQTFARPAASTGRGCARTSLSRAAGPAPHTSPGSR